MGSRELGQFVVRGGRFDVVYRCTGSGDVSVSNNGRQSPVTPCDGIENVARIVTDEPKQRVAITVEDADHWELFVRVTPPGA